MTYSLSVIAPFLNEEGNLKAFLTRTTRTLDHLGVDYEIVLVDDGSEDSSVDVVNSFLAETPAANIMMVHHPRNRGIFASWHSGLDASSKRLSVLIDSDLQNPPEAIAQLFDAFIRNPCHFVQGTRTSLEMHSRGRWFLSRGLNTLLNFFFRSSAKDHKSGFVLGPTNLMKEALTFSSHLKAGQTFIRAGIESRGYLMQEVETIFFPRVAGNSFLLGQLFPTIIRALFEIIVVRGELSLAKSQNVLEPLGRLVPQRDRSRPRIFREKFFRWVFFFTLRFHTWNISENSARYLQILEQSDWFSAEQIEEITLQRLRRLLWHVFGRVPHYRRYFFENKMLPSDLVRVADISKLPLLSKDDVRNSLHFELFAVGTDRNRLHRIATSGSTGIPFTTYATWDQLDVRFATTLRAQQMTGWRFGDRQMRFWHQHLGMRKSEIVREHLNARVSRRGFIPAFELDEEKVRALIKRIETEKPVLIDGYAESFNYLAQAIHPNSLRHSPHAVMTSAQILTRQTRKVIEQRLGTQVFDKYGSREFSGIAYECDAHEGHHVQWESYVVEILKNGRPAKPGEIGEVVVTDLNNFSVPLIRYRIGDLAEAMDQEVCDCGRSSTRIGQIVGRTQALVLVAGGKWLPGSFFLHFFKDYDGIVRQFQVVQESPQGFTLKIVKGEHWSAKSWQLCRAKLREYTGEATCIEEEFVEQIPLLGTGKRNPVISRLIVDFQSL